MATADSVKFPTGSSYEGSWNEILKCMYGFGCYEYPDGSVYHGYFANGQFQGFGSVKLTAPYNLTLRGYFNNGKLIKILDMYFEDGLRVKAELKPKTKLDFTEWTYCSKEDRRFPAEIRTGLRAVGPGALTTRNAVDRELTADQYDTEQGVYNLKSGFITQRMPPFKASKFVQCSEEINWIEKNCRKGYESGERHEPVKAICRETIESNISNQIFMDRKFGEDCSLQQKPGHKYFAKLYAIEMAEAKRFMSKTLEDHYGGKIATNMGNLYSSGSFIAEKSTSCSQFSKEHIKDPTLENIVCWKSDNNDHEQLKRSKTSLSMNMSLVNIKQTLFN